MRVSRTRIPVSIVHCCVVRLVQHLHARIEGRRLIGREKHCEQKRSVEDDEARHPHVERHNGSGVRVDGRLSDSLVLYHLLDLLFGHQHPLLS